MTTSADDGYAKALRAIKECRQEGSKVTALALSDLNLTSLPPEIGQLTALTTLYLDRNQLTTLPPEIGQLTALAKLSLSHNQLASLPPVIGQLTALTELYLNENQLTTLPPEIGQLTVLSELYLYGNRLTTLPPEIGQLTELTELYLHDNQLTTLPPEIGQLTALTVLDLYGNRLTTLPPEIGQLTELTELYLHDNQLTTLPPEIGQLTALTWLDLSHNQLTTLPPVIGQLTALTRLYLSRNQLATLPPEIGQLTALTTLYFSNNKLTTLPPHIGRLTALTGLYLYTNQLATLPPEIGQLTALTELDLSGNQLTTLPPEFCRLMTLTWLDLHYNQLATLPPEFGRLTALTELYLHDNPGLRLPAEILGPGWLAVHRSEATPKPAKEILEYYFATRGGEGRALREVKLILVGRGEVGKSTLADVLQGKRFVKNRKRTDGIAITPWDVKLRDGQAQALIWDFGGQEIMHGTHQFFLTHRSLYVVVVDGRHDRQKQDAEYWLKLVRAFGGDSPVLVVMNRQKAHSFDMDRQYLADKYGVPLEHFFRTDCERSKDIKPVRTAILKEIERMLAQEERFPARCWAVKDHLATMQEDYLSDEDYAAICAKRNVTDSAEQQKLLRRLADLGTVVSFPDEIKLAELTVLNPEWVTDGIYRVITNESLQEQKHGKLTLSLLRKLLPKERWPKPMHLRYLIDLMEKFELCFPLPDADGTVLVPELLPDKTPAFPDWDAAQCVVFLYQYPVLPHGVLPRFITKTHPLSEKGPRWRSGAVLADDGAEALIKADYDQNLITVWVRGEHRDARRALLKVVRHHFDQIHGRIKELNPAEQVAVPGHPDVTVPYHDLILDERDGKRTVRVTIENRRVELPISDLLDGVESRQERQRRALIDWAKGSLIVHGNYYEGDKIMNDDHSIHVGRDNYGQVGQTLANCTNIIQQQPSGKTKELLGVLQQDVQELIKGLPAHKREAAPKVAEDLEVIVKQSAAEKPNRKWYSISAEGLLEASTWVKDFSGNIAGTLLNLGKKLWPDFELPQQD